VARATRVRYSIVALALVLNLVSYTDRVCISVAAPKIRAEFGYSPTQMGFVFSIFSLAYFLFLTPWGVVADRRGSRGLVPMAIFWWSVFTALTAAAWNFVSLLVIRFVFGSLEAALSPAVASAFTRWIPVSERSTAFGAFSSGGRIGGTIAPPLAALLVLRFGWRSAFLTFAALGVVWALVWWFWYRDRPQDHPLVSQQELELIQAGRPVSQEAAPAPRWGMLLRSRPLLSLLAVAFGYTFMWQFYITWFPTYLMEKRGFTLAQAGSYAGLPFLFGLIGNALGGWVTDRISRRFGIRAGRLSLGFAALILSAALLLSGVLHPGRNTAAVLLALAAGFGDMVLGACWASAVEIGGKSAGAVSGLMNSASNFGGFVSPVLMGWVFDVWKDWNSVLFAAVAANVISAFLWLGTQPRSRELPS